MPVKASEFKGSIARSLRAEGHRQGKAQGEARARGKDLLRVLQFRNIEVGDAERERITACTDPGTLDTWFERAFTVESAEALFAED